MAVITLERGKKQKIVVPVSYQGNKRKTHCEIFYGSKTDAEIRESEIKKQIRTGTYIANDKITLEELTNEWLKIKKESVTLKTYVSYEKYAKNIINYMGKLKLKDITAFNLQEFYYFLRTNTTFAEKTILHHYNILSNIFSLAEKWNLIIKNPHKAIDRPKLHKVEMRCYSKEDTIKLLRALKKEPLKVQAIIILALDSSCRRGELTGLTWNDLNFTTRELDINKTTQYVPGYGIYEKDTKNTSSNRKIVLSKLTCSILQKYRKEQLETQLKLANKWENSNRIFTTDYGAGMHPNTPSSILARVIKKYELKEINFHGLRHTSISLQIQQGIQPQIISKRAGHSNLSTTHSIYSHFFKESYKEVADKMDDILNIK